METSAPRVKTKTKMGKLINEKYPFKYTSTDFIAYTGTLPNCIPSGTSSCEPMDRGLTKLMQLLLEKYCQESPSANPLEADISELDIECLLEANPDIEIGDDLTLKDLLIYYKDHLCYIYGRLCVECGGETDTTCIIEKIIPCNEFRRFTLIFPETINYTGSEEQDINLVVTLPGAANGDPKEFVIPAPYTVEDVLTQIQSEWENPEFTVSFLDNSLYLVYSPQLQSPVFGFTVTYEDNVAMETLGNLNEMDFFAQNGSTNAAAALPYLQTGTFVWDGCTEEVSGNFCEFIQDHENRITALENETTPSSEPYVPDPLVIPIYRVINIQNQNEIVADIQHYFKYRTSDYYFSKTEDGTRLDSLTINGQSSLGDFGRLWLDSDTNYLRYKYTQETPFPTGDDNFSLYLSDGSGSNYVIPITVYSINACCEGEPAPSGEGFLYEYVIEFDVTGWNSELQFQDVNATITRTPSGGFQSVSAEPAFVLRLTHNLAIVGTYDVIPTYLDSVAGAISVDTQDTDYVDIQLANNPFNTLGTNIRIKVIISQ